MKDGIIGRTWTIVIAAVAMIAVAVVVLSCRDSSPPAEIRNVLLISIDTCRADHLGCYGYPLDTTPNIDAIAGEAAVFENAISPFPYTLPAHCSMLTGTIGPYHKVLDNSDYELADDDVTLAELLKGKGFSTAAFVSSFILDSRFGLAQGFDVYDDDFENQINTTGISQRGGDEVTRHGIEWIEDHKDERSFVFLHYYDAHFTYDPPEPFASKFKNVPPPAYVPTTFEQALFDGYAGEIAYVDHCIGQVVGKLKELGLYDSTLIVITSDHGEMLGQHGEGFHGYFIYQPAVRVPLIIKMPYASGSRRIAGTVGLVDIVPTVCSLLDIDLSTPVQGRDLSPFLDGGGAGVEGRSLFCQSLEPTKYNANSLMGVVTDRYKYIHTTRRELYDLVEDPGELNNLASVQPERLAEMEQQLTRILEQSSRDTVQSGAGMDVQTRKRIESLGYVGGAVDENFDLNRGGEDPKDLIGYHVRMMRIGFLIHKEQYDVAAGLCRELIAERPSFYRPYFNLAKIAREREDFAEAVIQLNKVIEMKPDHVYSYEGLGGVYKSLGQLDNAVASYSKALELMGDYVEVYHKLAICLYDQGKYRAADKYVTDALRANPLYVDAAVSLAEKLIGKQQIRLAYERYLRVLELESDSVNVLNSLAWIEAASPIEGLKKPAQAVEKALRACELTDYGTAEVVDTLAVAYAAAGRFSEAKEAAQKAIQLAQSAGNNALAGRIGDRLALYELKKPYIDRSLALAAGQQ